MPSIEMQSIAPRFTVADVVRAAEWYRDTLGFEIQDYFNGHLHDEQGNDVLDADGNLKEGPPAFVHVKHGEATIQLSLAEGPRSIPQDGAYIWMKGVEALFQHATARHADFLYPLETMPYGIKEFAVRDPDGHSLCFGEYL